jgi:ubiquitin-protein ligase
MLLLSEENQDWNCSSSIPATLLAIQAFLSTLNPHACVNHDACKLFRQDDLAYNSKVQEWVQLYASAPPPPVAP